MAYLPCSFHDPAAAPGYHRMLNWMIKHTRKDPTPLVEEIFVALKAQTVTVPGSDAAELVIPQLAANIKALKEQRNTIAEQVEQMLDDFPLCEVLDRACPESASRPQRKSSLPSVTAPTLTVLATWLHTRASLLSRDDQGHQSEVNSQHDQAISG